MVITVQLLTQQLDQWPKFLSESMYGPGLLTIGEGAGGAVV